MRTYWAVTREDGTLETYYIGGDPIVRGEIESAKADSKNFDKNNGVLEVAIIPAAALKRLVDAAQSKVETCRRCGGVGKIHLFQTDGFSDGTENCPSCHNFRLALSEWKDD